MQFPIPLQRDFLTGFWSTYYYKGLRSQVVLRIRIHRIHVFLGLLDPDPLVRRMDPDPAPDPVPSIIKQKI
jgi:hypothetical protein